MNSVLLSLYHHLPEPARSIAAGMRGYVLRRWRYGPETEDLVEEALDRETWSSERWRAWQEERLVCILCRAATMVPYYREHWAERRRNGDRRSWEDLENWPILEKEFLRENPKAFLVDTCTIRHMFHEHTSGTTGKPLDLWWSPDAVRSWYALFEARCRRWYGVSRHDRWAVLGGQLITPVNQRRPPFWVWNRALNQLYMSSYHLTPDLVPSYLDALVRYRITYLYGYPSSLYALAQGVLARGRTDLGMAVAVTNAEPLFDYQREAIAGAFQCPVRETYGMAEIVTAASQCEAGRLHLWPEVGVVELVEGDRVSGNGTAGELVCTGLLNADMPLVRYRVGDCGTLAPKPVSSCACGRSLPVLASLEGRFDDVLYTSDGRRVGRLDPVFKKRLPILEAQIIQEALDRICVRYVPALNYTAKAGDAIIDGLRARLGAIDVVLDAVDEVPRDANGKFRAVICHLSPDERNRLNGMSG